MRPGVDADLTQRVTQTSAIAHQTAGHNEFTQWIDRGQRVASRERDEHFRSAIKEHVRSNQKASNPLLHKRREGRLDIMFDGGFGDNQLRPSESAAA
jgi:hypothetical protein